MKPDFVYNRYSRVIYDEMKTILDNKSGALYCMMRDQMGFGDNITENITGIDFTSDNITSTMCLLTCELLTGYYEAGISAAIALEFTNQFMVAHNQVLLDNKAERCEKSVNKKWDFRQAINVGDGFYAMARTSLFGLVDKISMTDTVLALNLLDEACIEMCEGQYLDLDCRNNFKVMESTYFRIAELKSGSIMGCSMGLGGLAANVGGDIAQILNMSGKRFGIAYQIVNDILAIESSKDDLMKTEFYLKDRHLFPCVLMLGNDRYTKEKKFRSLYSKPTLDPRDIAEIVETINYSDAIQISYNRAQSMIDAGLSILKDSHIPNDAIAGFTAEVVPLIMQRD